MITFSKIIQTRVKKSMISIHGPLEKLYQLLEILRRVMHLIEISLSMKASSDLEKMTLSLEKRKLYY
jgi:hypothetical protein